MPSTGDDRGIDAMGLIDGVLPGSGPLGKSSGAGFMHQVAASIDGSATLEHKEEQSYNSHFSSVLPRVQRFHGADGTTESTAMVLPLRKTADHLFRIYWEYSHPLFPWLDETQVVKSYEALWTSTCEETFLSEQIFHCTLNLMFAIACMIDPVGKPSEQREKADAYYWRSRALLHVDLLAASGFDLMQALMLMAQYLQSTKKPDECFQSIGIAIGIARDIGLHLPDCTKSITDVSDRELARRVWHGCIVMDRIAAMSFGRPTRISDDLVQQAAFPTAGRKLQIVVESTRPDDQPREWDFFIAYCKLHHILGRVLDYFYAGNDHLSNTSGSDRPETLALPELFEKLVTIETSLAKWRRDLKNHLVFPSLIGDQATMRCNPLYANVLHARYLYVHVLMYRPSFFFRPGSSAKPSDDNSYSLELSTASFVSLKSQTLCVQAAQQIIQLIYSTVYSKLDHSGQKALPAWWYSVFYLYTASIVLIAAHLHPQIFDIVPRPALNEDLLRAFDLLQQYEPYTDSAQKCISALKLLCDKLAIPINLSPATNTEPFDAGMLEGFVLPSQPTNNVAGFPFDMSWLDTSAVQWDDNLWATSSLHFGSGAGTS